MTGSGKDKTGWCAEFAKIIGAEAPVTEAALNACAQDREYMQNLLLSREHAGFFKYLLENPPRVKGTPLTDNQAKAFVKEWAGIMHHREQREGYLRRYREFLYPPQSTCTGKAADISPPDFRGVFLDNNSTTMLRPEIQSLLCDYDKGRYGFGNPGSPTPQGYLARIQVEEAREKVAAVLGVKPSCIIFCGSGSEANNMAVKGTAFQNMKKKGRLITTRAEHMSVLSTMDFLEGLGFDITYIPVDTYGSPDLEALCEALRQDTLLVSLMAANNEVGTISPMEEIGRICSAAGVPYMSDGVQAFGKIELKPLEWNISLMTMAAHKIGGPKGVGALYAREGVQLMPLVHGGSQEMQRRAGTENVGHIIAFGEAAALAADEMEKEAKRQDDLREYFAQKLSGRIPGIKINGHPAEHMHNNLSVSFPGIDSGAFLKSLARAGISASAGSACSAALEPHSHVLSAMGIMPEGTAVIRFGIGRETKQEDIDYTLRCIGEITDWLSGNN